MFTSAAASGKQQATQYSNKQVPLQQAAGAQNAAMAGGEGERFSGLRTSAKFQQQQQQQPAAPIQAKKKNDFLLSFGGIQEGQVIPFNVASHFPSAASYFPSTLDSTRPLDCGREVETRFDPLKSRRLAVVEYDEVRQEEASHRHMEVLLARVHTLAEREQYRSHVYAKAQEIKAAQWKEMMMNNKNPSKELDVPLASFHVPRKNELVYPGAMARGFHNSSSKFKGYPTLNENIAVPASDELYLRFKPLADRRKKLASVDAIRTRDAYNRHAEAMIERQQQIKNNNAVHANKVAANRAKMDLQAMAVLDAESHRQMEDIQRHDALIAEKVAHVKEDRESHAQHAAENRKELQDMMRLLSGADSEKAFFHPAVITRGFPRTSALFADYPTYTKDESFTIPASDEKYMRFKPLLSHRKKLAAFDQRRHAEADDRRADLLKSRQQQLRFTREHRARKAAEARAAMAADDEERINAENQRQMADIERHDALIAERQAHLKEDTESHAQHAAENRADRAHNRELKLAAAGAGELESFGQKEEVHPAVIAAHFPHTSAAFAGCPSIVSDESVAVPLAEEQAHRFDCVHERRHQLAEVDDCRHADADERRAEMLESRQRLQDEDEMRGLLAAASRSSQNTMAVIDAVTQLEHNEQASINHGRFLKNRQERILHRESEHARHVQRLREAGWQGPLRGVDDKILLYGAPTNVAESGLVAPAYVASRFHHNSSYFNNHGSNNYMTEWIPVSEEEKLRFDALWARRQAIAPFEQDRVDAASEKHEGFLVDRQAALELKDYQWSQKVEAAHERREALYADAVVASRELEKMQSLGNGGEAVVASGGYSYDAIAPHSYMYEALDSHFPNSAARIRDRDDVCMEDQERHAAAEARHEADLKAKVFVLWSDHQRWAKRTSQMRQKPIQERKAAAKKSREKLMTADERRAAILDARVKSLHEKDIQRRAKGTQALKDRQTAQMAFGQSTEQLECAKQQRMDLHKEEAEAHHLQQQQEQNAEEPKQNEEEQPIMVDKIAPAAAEIVASSAGGPSPAILPQEGEIEQQSSTPNAKNLKFDAAQHATSDDALQKDAENKNENVDLSENVEKSNNNNNSKDIAAAGGAPSVVDREVDDLVSAPAASNDRALPADKNANNGPKVDKSAVNIIPVHSSAFPPAGPSNTNNPKEKETKAKSRKMCCA